MVVIGAIMEHIEEAGIHSGDSACSIPYVTLSDNVVSTIRNWTTNLARALDVVGLMNIQYAVQGEQVYILEANPRASRTVPFVSKTIGVPLAKMASLVMSGRTLESLNFTKEPVVRHVTVKEAVLPFNKFPGADTLLGPEMRSTGEVMGIDSDFGRAFAKAEIAASVNLPTTGTVFVSVSDRHKQAIIPVVLALIDLGFKIVSTSGTRKTLLDNGIEVDLIYKLHEGRPHIIDSIKNQKIQFIINTPDGEDGKGDGRSIRRMALDYKLPIITTIAGAKATVAALHSLSSHPLDVKALQDYMNPV